MGKHREDELMDEIHKRVFDVEQEKQKKEEEELAYEALDEASEGLNREEVEQVAQQVRREFAAKEEASRKRLRAAIIAVAAAVAFAALIAIPKYNAMVRLDESVKTQWSQVENVYQRRLDLIPNLVKTVQAYAAHEKAIFDALAQARAKAGGTLSADLNNAAQFQEFQQAQRELSATLGRMMAIVESNPEMKSDQNFLALQAQLEGSENRIAVERKRFNEAAQGYNSYIKRFPQNMLAGLFGFDEKAYFKADAGAEHAPEINFQ